MTSIESRLRRRDDEVAATERAARAFRERAAREELIDIAYGWVDTPVGRMLAAATDEGLLRLGFESERVDVTLAELARKVSPRILQDERRLERIRRQLGEYFEGRRKAFDMPLDRSLMHGFHRQVLDATERIPYGAVSTYREVAERAGNARASRAAGNGSSYSARQSNSPSTLSGWFPSDCTSTAAASEPSSAAAGRDPPAARASVAVASSASPQPNGSIA